MFTRESVRALLLLDATSTSPSWLWYATRGLGTAALLLLTATVVLGIGTAGRWRDEATPGFVLANLHRNLSLLAVLTVIAHLVTTVLDPFAGIQIRDVIIPVGAKYRPVWLGLGVVAFEVMVAIALTSLLRDRIGQKAWRLIHWSAYGSWPLAVFHGLGTGSDQQAPWLIGVVTGCVAAVVIALARRVVSIESPTVRTGAAVATGVVLYVGAAWTIQGPLQPGWAAKAGTPAVKVAKKGPVHPGPGGFSDPLAGVMMRDPSGNTQISFRDTADPELTIFIRSPTSSESLPVMTLQRGKRALCSVPVSVGLTLYAVCGNTRLTITLFGPLPTQAGSTSISGQLATSGPLN